MINVHSTHIPIFSGCDILMVINLITQPTYLLQSTIIGKVVQLKNILFMYVFNIEFREGKHKKTIKSLRSVRTKVVQVKKNIYYKVFFLRNSPSIEYKLIRFLTQITWIYFRSRGGHKIINMISLQLKITEFFKKY